MVSKNCVESSFQELSSPADIRVVSVARDAVDAARLIVRAARRSRAPGYDKRTLTRSPYR